MEMSRETINSLSEYFERTFGMPYEDFKKLDYEVQQILISSYKNTQKNKKNNIANVMLGSGEHAIFIKVEKGKRIMIGSGEHSCFIKAGLTPEEEMREFDGDIYEPQDIDEPEPSVNQTIPKEVFALFGNKVEVR